VEPDRLSRELAENLEAARITAEALSHDAQLARDTVGRWVRGTTVPTLAALRAVEKVLGSRLGRAVDLSAAVGERRSARQRDQLPTDGTQRGEIVLYLERLIGWLSTDPWPQDMRFAGPALAPAAIERKLRIASGRGAGQRDLDADDGGPRSGR
jgi:transcriptional regulator with XRE-family HTH domain